MLITQMKQWVENALWSWKNCISFRFDGYNDNIDRCAFFEELNSGWYQMYIYPYDDWYNPTISKERAYRLGGFPQQYNFFVSEEDYDIIMNEEDTSNSSSKILEKLFKRKLPR